MKAVIASKPGIISLGNKAYPETIGSTEVRLKVRTAGICGSDMHIYKGTNPFVTYPRIIGHEFAGEIEAVGSNAKGFQIGDHVVVDPVSSCGLCYACRLGRQNVCKTLSVIGIHEDGGMQQYITLPTSFLHKIPDRISWEVAALVEPFTIAAQATSRGRVTAEDTACIIGAGPIGTAVMMVCKMIGAKVLVIDINPARLDMAKKLGADTVVDPAAPREKKVLDHFTKHGGFNIVIDAAGVPEAFEKAIDITSPAGRVVTLGFSPNSSAITQKEITKKELDIMGSRLHTNKFPKVIEWIDKDLIDPGLLVTHHFDAERVEEAIQLIEKAPSVVCKTVINF